jgi:AcrR family transcriptional regulator
MQIKKDEIKNGILKEAEKEFLINGFEKASIRKIAASAGTTIGNFYNYFENKEALFSELVQDELEGFKLFINNHDNFEASDSLLDISDMPKLRKLLEEIILNVIPIFSNSLLLLVECSKGTRYENIRNEIINFLKEHFIEHMNCSDSKDDLYEFSGVIAEQFLSGILLIIRNFSDDKLRKTLLTDYILFTILGTMGFLNRLE